MMQKKIQKSFASIGIELSKVQVKQFFRYYELLIEWNSKMNLTAITEFEEVLLKHFLDSILAFKIYDFEKAETLIDIGTGAGFPGIPLKIIYPHLQVTLVDALNKRVQYLNTVIDELSLKGVEAMHGRAEDLARTDIREAFDVCVSRAVSQLNVLCEYCLPFLKVGGLFISYKGAKTYEEVEQSSNAINLLGGELIEVTDTMVLSSDIKRGFVCIKKVKNTDLKYPRRAGKPIKKPL